MRKISVIGLGYVGLPIAVEFGLSKNFNHTKVIGYDVSKQRINELNAGYDRTKEVSNKELIGANILFSFDECVLKQADFYIITVPTPVATDKCPDLRYVILASEVVGRHIKVNDIVVLESTVYPGVTEEVVGPTIERVSGLKAGKDFFLGYSPERINPGDKFHRFSSIKKVVSGQNNEVLSIIAEVYSSVVQAGVYKAPSIKVAEAAKVIENTQRDINIAFVNELSMIFKRMNIDTMDVLEAAATKWNFININPGLVGGHCISVDPYYLTYRAEQFGYHPEVILSGRRINDNMGICIVHEVMKALIKLKKNGGLTIGILGLTFKENCPDIRNSRVVDIINELKEYGAGIICNDPMANDDEVVKEMGVHITPLEEFPVCDAIILAVKHDIYIKNGWESINSVLNCINGSVVYDVKSVLPRENAPRGITLLRL